jgi:hypothetical protein
MMDSRRMRNEPGERGPLGPRFDTRTVATLQTGRLTPAARQRVSCVVFACIVSHCLSAAPAAADVLDILAEHHAWGRFEPGSWARVKETRYSTMPAGGEKVEGTTITTSRLVAVDAESYTLSVETATDGAATEPVTTRLGWDDLPIDTDRTLRLSVGEIKIEGRSCTCQTHELTTSMAGITTVNKWWYCPDQSPYLLKRIVRVSSGPPHSTSVETLSLAVERDVLGQKLSCYQTRTVDTLETRSTQTIAFGSPEVPGGLVYSESQTRDKQRGQVATSRVELEAFEAVK